MTVASEALPPATEPPGEPATEPSPDPTTEPSAADPAAPPAGLPAESSAKPRRRVWLRFIVAFALSLVLFALLAGAALFAYAASYDGRILAGVHVGTVDLSGLDRDQAAAQLAAAYSGYGDGQVVIHTVAGDASVPYRAFSRQPDIDAMVEEAMSVGRSGTSVERALAASRTAIHGVVLEPRVALDKFSLAYGVLSALRPLEQAPRSATIGIAANGIIMTGAWPGRDIDEAGAYAAALAAAGRSDAPAAVEVEATATELPPAQTDDAVLAAKATAERMIGDVVVTDGSKSWTIGAATVKRWLHFVPRADGSVDPVIDEAAVPAALAAVAKDVLQKPVSSAFLTGKDGTIVGVTASKDGRSLDEARTTAAIATAMAARGEGAAPAPIPAVIATVKPERTTAEAKQIAPLMVRLSYWKTWFPVSERNYWGANIWLPALYINGTVLEPGQTFEWFRTVGPITRARGFGSGGVIAGDHTEPTGAIGGGMCSSSTTLFNAALRAGLKMGSRANHSYYIDRYPLGLDATVTIKGGRTTTMTFTNDMDHPILIRGIKIKGSGGKGWVRYEIWGVPDGRTVSISKPAVTNVRKATTNTVEVTTLKAGVRKQTEYPVNGMDVSVTRVVRDRNGHVIHRETYRSHYQLWNGRIEVGV
jgi:vancomycin resistance protein YoaR